MDHTLYKWCFSKHVFHTIYVCRCSFDIGQEISVSVACLILLPPSEVAAAPFYYLCSFWVWPASGGGRSTLFIALPPLPLLYTANMQMGLCSRRGRGQGKGREGRGVGGHFHFYIHFFPTQQRQYCTTDPPNFSLHGRHDGNIIIFGGLHAWSILWLHTRCEYGDIHSIIY